jgi:hypothetical protein
MHGPARAVSRVGLIVRRRAIGVIDRAAISRSTDRTIHQINQSVDADSARMW